VIHFVRRDVMEDPGEVGSFTEVGVVPCHPRVDREAIGAGGGHSVYLVSFAEQQFHQIGAILAGDAGNEGNGRLQSGLLKG
jgi:hypothetical protein